MWVGAGTSRTIHLQIASGKVSQGLGATSSSTMGRSIPLLWGFASVAVFLLLPALLFAQLGSPRFSEGDRIIYRFGNKNEPGTVVSWDSGSQLIEVRLDSEPDRKRKVPVRLVTLGEDNEPVADLRTWTDSTGKFSLEARLVRVAAGQVTLQRVDRTLVTLPFERLSAADQKFLRSGPAVEEVDNPFAAGATRPPPPAGPEPARPQPPAIGGAAPPRPGNSGVGAAAPTDPEFPPGLPELPDGFPGIPPGFPGLPGGIPGLPSVFPGVPGVPGGIPPEILASLPPEERERWQRVFGELGGMPNGGPDAVSPPGDVQQLPGLKVARPNLSSVQRLTIGGEAVAWSVQPDPLMGLPRFSETPACQLTNQPDSVQAIVIAQRSGKALVSLLDGARQVSRVALCDLASGALQGSFPLAGPAVLRDCLPSGALLVAIGTGESPTARERVDVWRPGPSGFESIVSFSPYLESKSALQRPVAWAGLVDETRMLTWSDGGELTLWTIPEAKAVWSVQVASPPALSPNRQYVVSKTLQDVVVLKTSNGMVVGRMPMLSYYPAHFAFREDGQRLAAAMDKRVLVWDLSNGAPVRDLAITATQPASSVDWVDADHLLVDDEFLVDPDRRVVLWHYLDVRKVNERRAVSAGGLTWVVLDSGISRHMRGLVLPHDRAVATATKLDPEQLLLMRRGSEVSIEVGFPERRQEVIDTLTAKLLQQGIQVVPNARTRLIVLKEQGKFEDLDFVVSGVGRPMEYNRRLYEITTRIQIVHDGQVAWSESTKAPIPRNIPERPRPGQSFDDVIAGVQQANVNFVLRVPLPRDLVRPTGTIAYGGSRIKVDTIEHVGGGL